MSYSNSRIQQFKNCPLSYYFKYEVGLNKVKDDKDDHHLVYGKAMHEALKLIYTGDSLEKAIQIFKENYSVQLDPEDMAKTQANGVTILENYVKHYTNDFKRFEIISVEEEEEMGYAEEEDFKLVLDLVVKLKDSGEYYGLDHKVVGGRNAYLSFEFWTQFSPNSQITKYTSHIFKKYGSCSGFYINAIGVGYRSRQYKGEPAGFWYKLERQMFNRNREQLKIEEKDTAYWISMIEKSKAENFYGMNTNSCKWCVYRQLCDPGWRWPEDRELIENMSYYKLKEKK